MRKNSIGHLIGGILDDFFMVHKDIETIHGLYHIVISEVEATLIRKTYLLTDRNKKKTAKILGISRNTLALKIKQFSLE